MSGHIVCLKVEFPNAELCWRWRNILKSFDLEVPDVGVRQERVLLVGVEEAEVLHDDGDKQVQHDVSDDDVEAAEEDDGGHEVSAV
jgi:hypothetical protein